MKRLLDTAHLYMIVGVVSGLYYRELTKAEHFTEQTQLSVVHTHILALGMLFFLVVLVLERLFHLTASALFVWFFWIYNAGLVLTVGMMTWHGTLTVLGRDSGAAVSGIAGLGHILLTAGLVLLFVTIGKRLPTGPQTSPVGATSPTHATAEDR